MCVHNSQVRYRLGLVAEEAGLLGYWVVTLTRLWYPLACMRTGSVEGWLGRPSAPVNLCEVWSWIWELIRQLCALAGVGDRLN